MTNENYALQPGTVLQEKYRIEAVLGKGGFGITYRALHTGLQKTVAIKEFFMRGACERQAGTTHVSTTQSNRETADRFLRKFIKEAQLIASLSHPGIVRVSDIFEANGTAYYVMDYVEGENLNDRVGRLGRLSEAEALACIRQVGDALRYVHARHMLHLDVKPANILLDRESGRAVLIDFGVAKQYDNAGEQTSSTPAAVSNGYSPIEQYGQGAGVSAFTPATDVYALAATLYKLLTGITPPPSAELLGGEAELPPYPAEVSQASRNAIKQALQMRKARPQSVEAFLKLLEPDDTHPATGRPAMCSPRTDEETVLRPAEKPQKPAAPPKVQPTPQKGQTENRPSGNRKKYLRMAAGACALVLLAAITVFVMTRPQAPAASGSPAAATSTSSPQGTADKEKAVTIKLDGHEYQYTGKLTDSVPDGYGKLKIDYDKWYEGMFSKGMKHGKGTYHWSNNDTFTGIWQYDEPQSGTMLYANGNRYEGEVVQIANEIYPKGQGTMTYKNGDTYQGNWNRNMKNGPGTYTWKDGRKYTGNWEDNKKEGYGTLYDAGGNVSYEGGWHNDQPTDY